MESTYHIQRAQEADALGRFYENLPKKPYCSDSKRIRYILNKNKAVQFRYIQINHPMLIRYIVFDLDYPGSAFSWEEKGLPPFSIVVINRNNAHCHGIYEIDGVFKGTASKKTKKLLKKIIKSYKNILNADRVITTQKQLVKNPLHKDWEVICNGGRYTLSELAEYIRYPNKSNKIRKKKPDDLIDPSSRNVTLFNMGRFFAYDNVSQLEDKDALYREVNSYLNNKNTTVIPSYFSNPLPQNEIISISKSITKWVWERRSSFKKYNTGIMGFEKIKGLSKKDYVKEVKRRQSLAGKRTSALRRTNTLKTLTDAYIRLLGQSNKVTQKMLSNHTGYSIRTVKYYWHEIIEGAKRSNQGNSPVGPVMVYGGEQNGKIFDMMDMSNKEKNYFSEKNAIKCLWSYKVIQDTG